MDEMEIKLLAYWEFCLKYTDMRALAPVPLRDQRSLQNWMVSNRPLAEGEDDFILVLEDLVAAKRKGESAKPPNEIQEGIFDWIANHPDSLITKLFEEKDANKKTGNQMIHHLSKDRIIYVADISFALVAVVIMLVPVFLMFLKAFRREVLAIIVAVFVALFTTFVATVVRLQAHDLVICTATYATILVALLGNTSNTPNQTVPLCSCGHSQ
ncbi:hypothetical protein B0J14DRAFT_580081 [Halenospora varia]|nr:hypothetical protein B0J14DRAFT_580081 [Halenospora varia]